LCDLKYIFKKSYNCKVTTEKSIAQKKEVPITQINVEILSTSLLTLYGSTDNTKIEIKR